MTLHRSALPTSGPGAHTLQTMVDGKSYIHPLSLSHTFIDILNYYDKFSGLFPVLYTGRGLT